MSSKKTWVAVASGLAFLLILSLFWFPLNAPTRAQQIQSPRADFENALWVAGSDGIIKLATATGTILFDIPDAEDIQAVAVDDRRGILWAFGKRTLRAYTFNGQLVRRVPVSLPDEDDDDDDALIALTVNSDDGTVWLGVHKTVFRFDAQGQLRSTIPLADNVRALALDNTAIHLWIATKKTLTAYDDSGRVVANINLGKNPDVRDIAVDADSREIWVALKNTLRLYDAIGRLLLEIAIKNLEHIASDGQGGVWAATNKDLSRLDAFGRVLFKLKPFADDDDIVALVVDPADLSVWVASEEALSHISADGPILHRLKFADDIHALAVYADIIPPVVAFTAPIEGSLLKTNTPEIRVTYSDIGIGVDTATLRMQADDRDLAVDCTFGDTSATCTPATPLPEGRITLTATIADHNGNISEQAEVSFTVDTIPPAITLDAPRDGTVTNQAQQTFVGHLSETASLTLNGQAVSLGPRNEFSHGPLTLAEGLNTFELVATDLAGNIGRLSVRVTLDTKPPAPINPAQVSVSAITDGQVQVSGVAGSVEPGATVTITNTRTGQKVTVTANPDGSFTATIAVQRGDVLSIVIIDRAGNTSQSKLVPAALAADFAVEVAPADGRVLQGASTTYVVELQNIGAEPFTGLATLTVMGLPTGVSASLTPSTLTGGQRATLTVTAAATAPTGSANLTIQAVASIDAGVITRTAVVNLTVEAGGRTALLGQFTLVDGTPLKGVKLALAGKTTETDGGGNFRFMDLPAGTHTLSVDTTPVHPSFPIYGADVTLTAGQATQLPPFRITPPPPPERFTPIQNAAQDQVVTDPRFPGASITLPAGAAVTGWDGQPKTKIAIQQLSPDQLPMLPPPGPTRSLYQFHFGTPMGGLPSTPLPVTLPNDQGLNPGDKAEIWYYDAAPMPGVPGAWRLAGLGTVSADGRTVVSDPGVGIARFCGVCGTTCIIQRQEGQENRNPDGPTGGDPVDLALGQMIVEKTDLVLPGRLPAVVHRTYNPFDPFGAIAGFELGLGPGWALSVDVVLLEVNASLRRLVLPGNARFEFVQQPNGSFVNATHPRFAGAVLTVDAQGGHLLHLKDGTVWGFTPSFLAGLHLLAEQVDRNGNSLIIERDSSGQITRLVEPSGRALRFTSAAGRITEVTDPLGRTVRYGYNSARRLETVTDPAGGVTRYTYDSAGRILTITDPRGITYLTNEYDASGRVARQTQADGGVWTFQYLRASCSSSIPGVIVICFLPSSPIGVIMTDPRGNVTTHRFSPAGFVREMVDALGQTTSFERDARGQVVAIADPFGRVTRFDYDGAGNVTRITDAAGNVRIFEYEPTFNRLTKLTDPLGNVTIFTYDARGNLLSITDPLGNVTRVAYNALGQPVSTTDPLGNITRFGYDAVGNLAGIIDPLGNATRRTYDLVSRLIAQTDPRGRTTHFAYDELNRIEQIVDALDGVTAFSYDGNGNLLTVTDARGNTSTHTYDAMDRLATRRDPVGAVESFDYDGAGNLIRHTDRKRQGNTFSYDALNRRIGARYADGTTTSFIYDAVGRLVQAEDSGGGTILNEYDVLDRLIAQTTGLGAISYQYDTLGRRTRMTVAGQDPVTYAYNANSRLSQIVQGSQVVDFAYDALGRRTRLTLPNGVSTEYRYDVTSRLTELIYRNATAVLGNLTYQYDAVGNRTQVGGSFARTLLPDPVASATYDAGNRQLTFGDKRMSFDPNGNLTSITDPSGVRTFTWDTRNRLVSLTGPSTTASFTYDPFGRRATKEISGQVTRYIYDGPDIIQEVGSGTQVSFLRNLSIDELLVRIGTEHRLADALGSSIALIDSSGNVQTEYTYEPFGRTTTTGASSGNPFQYTGRENDATGLYYYRARYYAPDLHRFLSEDPISLAGGDTNLYVYVGNSSINWMDPLGLEKTRGKSRRSRQASQGVESIELRARNFSGFKHLFIQINFANGSATTLSAHPQYLGFGKLLSTPYGTRKANVPNDPESVKIGEIFDGDPNELASGLWAKARAYHGDVDYGYTANNSNSFIAALLALTDAKLELQGYRDWILFGSVVAPGVVDWTFGTAVGFERPLAPSHFE